MSNDPKKSVLRVHAIATWNVWKSHHEHCTLCGQNPQRAPDLEMLCLPGLASWDEYNIAESRLNDYRPDTRTE